MRKKVILVDLDGTLCNIEHRRPLLERKNWKEFFRLMPFDKPNEWCVTLCNALTSTGTEIIFVTGRHEEYRQITENWLSQYGFKQQLFMRPEGDYRQDAIVKTEIYNSKIEPYFEVLFCVDDRQQVVDAWRALGLVCLQCAIGNY